MGRAVGGAGDVNGDRIDDLIIGAHDAEPRAVTAAGESYVVFGRSDGFPPILPLGSLTSGDGSTGFVLTGLRTEGRSGYAVSGARDVNADGVDDIVIGAPANFLKAIAAPSESYVVYGRLDQALELR